jgi:hypothetical protein
MALDPKPIGRLTRHLLAALLLLGCQTASAAGTWSVVSLPQKPGEDIAPMAVTTDKAGSLYVAEVSLDRGLP